MPSFRSNGTLSVPERSNKRRATATNRAVSPSSSSSGSDGGSVGRGGAAGRQDGGERTSGNDITGGYQTSRTAVAVAAATTTPTTTTLICRNSAKVANRRHCRETRERKAQRERLLEEEVEVLELLKAIVENGPDLFSLHTVDIEAKFSFVCEDYQLRLQVRPDDILGRPLASSIVDPRDEHSVRFAVSQVIDRATNDDNDNNDIAHGGGAATCGATVNVRVVWGYLSYRASMTIGVGSEGLVVVTRLYDV